MRDEGWVLGLRVEGGGLWRWSAYGDIECCTTTRHIV